MESIPGSTPGRSEPLCCFSSLPRSPSSRLSPIRPLAISVIFCICSGSERTDSSIAPISPFIPFHRLLHPRGKFLSFRCCENVPEHGGQGLHIPFSGSRLHRISVKSCRQFCPTFRSGQFFETRSVRPLQEFLGVFFQIQKITPSLPAHSMPGRRKG